MCPRRLVLASVLALSLVGCKSKGTTTTSSGSAAGSAGSASADSGSAGSGGAASTVGDVKVTLGGEPIAVKRALIKQLPDGRAQLYLGEGGTCEQLMTNLFDGRDPHVLIDLYEALLADGKDSIGVGDVYAGPPSRADNNAKAEIRGELTKGAKVVVDLQVTAAIAKLEARGTVDAEVCGNQDMPPPATAGAATIKIAGREFVIRAGMKRGDDVELVDQPRDCTSAKYIGIRLKRERGTWQLDGTRMPAPLTGPAPALSVKPGPTKESPEPGHLMMQLGGSDKIGAYDVALAGIVEMVDCNYKPPAK